MSMTVNSRKTYVEISLLNLKHNIRYLKSCLDQGVFFCPMVKANAYGHGDVEISKVLEALDVSALGVVTFEEAETLRASGIRHPILVFDAVDPRYLQRMLKLNLTPVLSDMGQIQELARLKVPVKVHVKLNTGMNRLGFSLEKVKALREAINNSKNISVEGVCTHFLNGEDIQDPYGFTSQQIEKFNFAVQELGFEKTHLHYINSAALLNSPEVIRGIGMRPGISMYGESPFIGRRNTNLKPVLKWISSIELVRTIKKGEAVSYGPRWKASEDSIVGVVPVGYADGYPRVLTNNTSVLVDGHKVPVLGTICMDYMMVDLTHVQLTSRKVTIVGEDGGHTITAQDLGERYGSIAYEILTKIGNRVTRIYKSE